MILAENTSEAIRVVRVGRWVFKVLRPPESFATHKNPRLRMSGRDTLARWQRMADVSVGRPPLNPLTFIEQRLFVSRFIEGRHPTPDELQPIVRRVELLRLGVLDVSRENVILGPDGPVVVDWFMKRR